MKLIVPTILLSSGFSLLTAVPLLGQTATARPIPPSSVNRAPEIPVNQDVKEKAEDAALLQQLESSTPQSATQTFPKNQWTTPAAGARGGAGAAAWGASPAPFRGERLLTRSAATPKALLVRTSTPEPKAQAALEEDLAVMAHILGKSIEDLPGGQAHSLNALGVDVFFSPGSTPMRSLYLDNYGAVFFLNVSFPLVAPPEHPQEEKPAADSTWEDARQELYGQHLRGGMAGEPAEDYSQEKVDKLKETLFSAFKNATNIRELKPEEFVTAWVCGSANGAEGRFRTAKRNNTPGTLGGNVILAMPAKRTILTLRVSKADIDTFAKGKLNRDEFAKRARITTYTGDSAAGGSDGLVVGGVYGARGF